MRISTPTCLGDSCHVSSAPLRLISRRCLALAYQFLSRLCLRFACLCNAIATLAGHFEALASPTCDLLCHRLTPPHLALAIRFLSMPPHDSSLQSKPLRSPASHIYAFTSHSSHCIPRCAVLRFASAYHSVLCRCLSWPFDTMPSPIITVPNIADPLLLVSGLCHAIASLCGAVPLPL